jgi:hypothetical protein
MAKLAKQAHFCQFFAIKTALNGGWLGWKRGDVDEEDCRRHLRQSPSSFQRTAYKLNHNLSIEQKVLWSQ